MQVYKVFFKIIKKNKTELIIYIGIFLFFAVFLANTYSEPVNTDFTETKINMVFINNDRDSELIKGLKSYLGMHANFINLKDDRQALQDALFFRDISYILRIPENFTDRLLRGESVQVEKSTVPGSASAVYMDNIINKYLNTAGIYINNIKEISDSQLVNFIEKDLSHSTEVIMTSQVPKKNINEKATYYFNFLAYSLLSVLVLGVSTVMLVFNNSELKKRNLSSPLNHQTFSIQLILGNISFALFVWFVMTLLSLVLYGNYMFSGKGLLFILNSLAFTLTVLSLSYLISAIVKSKNAISAVTNVISVGSCFISGVFVPQNLLGNTVLKLASLTPTYWYVRSNNIIASMIGFSGEYLKPVILNILILLGFAAAALTMSLAITRQRRLSIS